MGERASQTHCPAGAIIGRLIYTEYGGAEAVLREGKQDFRVWGRGGWKVGWCWGHIEVGHKKHQALAP
jgi:hypothetical protein